jgi:hypothetical protein
VTALASFLFIGCGSNHNPVITGITAAPADSTVPGGTIRLKVTATDEDNDPLSYVWTATGGTFSNAAAESTVWTGPTAAGSYTAKATVSDDAGGSAEREQVLRIRAWRTGNCDEMNTDSTRLGNPGEITVQLDLTSFIPDGALVDSARLNAEFEPDTLDGVDFVIKLVPPSGDEKPVWESRPAYLEIDDELVAAVTNELAKGVWKLKINRIIAGEDGAIEEFALDIYYRY